MLERGAKISVPVRMMERKVQSFVFRRVLEEDHRVSFSKQVEVPWFHQTCRLEVWARLALLWDGEAGEPLLQVECVSTCFVLPMEPLVIPFLRCALCVGISIHVPFETSDFCCINGRGARDGCREPNAELSTAAELSRWK